MQTIEVLVYYCHPFCNTNMLQLNKIMMVTKSKYRFVFATVFALVANAALFSLLDLLIDFKAPVQNVQTSKSTALKTYHLAIHKKDEKQDTKVETNSITAKNKPSSVPVNQKPAVANAKPNSKKTPNKTSNSKTTTPRLVQNKPTLKKAKKNIDPKNNSVIKAIESNVQPTSNPNLTDTAIANTPKNSASAASNPKNGNHNPIRPVADKLASTVFDAKSIHKIYSPSPQYPRRAKRRNIQGWILTEFKIKKDGSVDQIKVIDGKNTTFFKSEVIKALALWRFAKQYPHEIQASMRFVFTLRG